MPQWKNTVGLSAAGILLRLNCNNTFLYTQQFVIVGTFIVQFIFSHTHFGRVSLTVCAWKGESPPSPWLAEASQSHASGLLLQR